MRPITAFVTDGDQRPALAITRSLGRRGVSVIVGAEQPSSLASASKYCARHVTYPSPYEQPDAFEQFVLDLAARERVDVVMPVSDVTTHLVAKNRPALVEHAATTAPPFDAFDQVSNKWALVQRAAACGIDTPRTLYVEDRSALSPLLHQIRYPAVIKPLRSRIRTSDGWLPAGVRYAQDQTELFRLYRDVDYLSNYPSLIQQRIVGPGVGVFVLCDRGRLLAAFAHRRLREKPPSGGVSVLSESIALDPDLVDQAMRLFGPIEWHGVAMMEFKQDCRTGRAFLMEVNARFWGSLHLAIQAGVDFPYLACQLALGERVDAPRQHTIGVKSRWLLGDLDHLLMRLFHHDANQNLPDGAPSRARVAFDFLQPLGSGMSYDVISRDDPRPFLHEARQYAKQCSASASAHLLPRHSPRRVGMFELAGGLTVRVLRYCGRTIRHAVERRQVNRIRRSPAALVDALKAGKAILVVCHGNIIRSPFAAYLLEQSLGEHPRVSIASAGLEAMPGRPPHPTALRKAAERRIDLSAHAASRIERDRVEASDVIFVMDIQQLLVLRRRFPEARKKTFLLTSLAPETPMEIRDPVDGDETVFHACFDHIARAVRPLAGVLGQSPQRT